MKQWRHRQWSALSKRTSGCCPLRIKAVESKSLNAYSYFGHLPPDLRAFPALLALQTLQQWLGVSGGFSMRDRLPASRRLPWINLDYSGRKGDYCRRECFRVAFRIACKFAPKARPYLPAASDSPRLPPSAAENARSTRLDNALPVVSEGRRNALSHRSYKRAGNLHRYFDYLESLPKVRPPTLLYARLELEMQSSLFKFKIEY